jgi:hypothetical protein
MKYLVINSAPDGRHVSLHASMDKANQKVRDMLGRPVNCELGISYYSDWGNRLIIETRPDNWTVGMERRVRMAYDARECGTATTSQTELLERLGW